jgi:hypothetical protein
MSSVDLIKQIAIKAVEATNPVNVLFGTVKSVDPLEIEIHQKLKLTKEFLVLTEQLTKYEVDSLVIRPGLNKGDKVVLMRVQGGHQFVVLDKVVD